MMILSAVPSRWWLYAAFSVLMILSAVLLQWWLLPAPLAQIQDARLRKKKRRGPLPSVDVRRKLEGGMKGLWPYLGVFTSRCLGPPGNRDFSLARELDRLGRSVDETLPVPLAPNESVLFTGGFSPFLAWPRLLLLLSCLWIGPAWSVFTALWLAWMVFTVIGLRSQYHRSGRFWLTEERLIWLPTRGDPLPVSLRDIHAASTGLSYRKGVEVHLMDGRTLHLESISQSERLAAAVMEMKPSTANAPGSSWALETGEAPEQETAGCFPIIIAVQVWRWLVRGWKCLLAWHARGLEPRAMPLCPDPWLQAAGPRKEKRRVPLPSVDVRRNLEGGIEVLEAAHAHYTSLKEVLRERRWKLHLGPRLATLRETLRQEPAVVEALDRLHRRARAEGWPGTGPALALAREVEELRAHVGELASSRLGTPGNGKVSLARELDRLERSVVETLPAPFAPGEKLLLTGGFSPSLAGPGLLLLGLWFTRCTASEVMRGTSEPSGSSGWFWLAWMVLTAVWLRSQYHRSARFWLTEQRLIWLPTRGEPLQVSPRDIHAPSTGVYFPKRVRVSLMDGRTFHLRFISHTARLAARLWSTASS